MPGLGAGAIALAGHMNMLLVWLLPLSGLAAMLQGALFSAHRFWVTSTTKAINNICIISAVLLLHRGIGIYALAMGYLAGFATQCLVLWFALRRCGFSYRWNCNCRDPRLKDTVRLVLYPLAGQMLGECRTLVENFFASFYAPGVLSALRYASRIIYALSGVLMSSVVTATTPMVAHYVAEKDFNAMKSAVRNGLKLLVFMSVPVCLWLTFTGDALISLLFQRGQFSHADAALTASLMALMAPERLPFDQHCLMALMAPYILFSRAISITQTPFYAVKDTRTLMFSMILSFGLYVLITPLLLFGLRVYGLPLATSASTALGAVVMCILLRRSFGPMGWIQLRTFSAQLVGAVAIACAGFFVGREVWLYFATPGVVGKLFAVGVPSVIGMTAFFGGALIFGLIDRGRFLLPFGLGKHELATSPTADSIPKP